MKDELLELPVRTWIGEKMCSGGLEVSSKQLLCGSARSDGVLTRREQSPDDVKPKILNLKVELDSSDPGSTESRPEARCTAEVQGAVDTKPESSGVVDYSDSGEDKTEDQECAESSEVTSEDNQGTAGFESSSSTKSKAQLLEADTSLLPPKVEQSCGTQHLAASEQHQDGGLATPGQNMIIEYVTVYNTVFILLFRNFEGLERHFINELYFNNNNNNDGDNVKLIFIC